MVHVIYARIIIQVSILPRLHTTSLPPGLETTVAIPQRYGRTESNSTRTGVFHVTPCGGWVTHVASSLRLDWGLRDSWIRYPLSEFSHLMHLHCTSSMCIISTHLHLAYMQELSTVGPTLPRSTSEDTNASPPTIFLVLLDRQQW